MAQNIDENVVQGFGSEWKRFDQRDISDEENQRIFHDYFRIFPWASLPAGSRGMDVGCGSGRWARLVAPQVGHLHCIDASAEALEVAKRNLGELGNCSFSQASVDAMPLEDASMDFGYSLGVLHHVPDTAAAIRSCVAKLKPGAPMLLYLYYRFDNRPFWFRALWSFTEPLRWTVSRVPGRMRHFLCEVLAAVIYWPLARVAGFLERRGMKPDRFPLAYYRDKPFYCMRNDALDRFGTRLEQRFTRVEIERMMRAAGLERIVIGNDPPYWCAIGYKLERI